MRHVAVLSLVLLTLACDGTTPVEPSNSASVLSPPAPSPPTAPLPPILGQRVRQAITVGEKITGTFNAWDEWLVELTASQAGTAVARLTWDNSRTWMIFKWEARQFQGEGVILLRMPVSAGRTYQLGIFDAFPWENYGTEFVLETALE